MHLSPLFASIPRINSTATTITKRRGVNPEERLGRIRQMLMPESSGISSTCTAGIQSRSNVRYTTSTVEFDLETLRTLVFQGIPESTDPSTIPTVCCVSNLRPLAWRALLGVVHDKPSKWQDQLQNRRSEYRQWKRDFVGGTSCQRGDGEVRTEDENQGDIFLMKEIQKDVCRTRSDVPFFFRGSIAQQQMLYILFVFAKLHPNIGYVQGMNEILAPVIFVCSADPTINRASDMEADAYHCFASVMSPLKVLFGPSPNDPLKTGTDLQMSRLVQLLRQHDATLWQHLNSVGLTPDLYSLRWYMTLMAREFPMQETLRVWDSLLADPKRFSFLHCVSCALVRSQRSHILNEDFTSGLKRLQSIHSIDIEQLLQAAEHMRQVDRTVDAQRSTSKSPTHEM